MGEDIKVGLDKRVERMGGKEIMEDAEERKWTRG